MYVCTEMTRRRARNKKRRLLPRANNKHTCEHLHGVREQKGRETQPDRADQVRHLTPSRKEMSAVEHTIIHIWSRPLPKKRVTRPESPRASPPTDIYFFVVSAMVSATSRHLRGLESCCCDTTECSVRCCTATFPTRSEATQGPRQWDARGGYGALCSWFR